MTPDDDEPSWSTIAEEIQRTPAPSEGIAAAAAAVASDLDDELEENETEDDMDYLVRVGSHYMAQAESWDGDPYRGGRSEGTLAGFPLAWPVIWGQPQLVDGVWRWGLPDAIFTFTIIPEVDRIPTAEGWMQMRREDLAGTAWSVIGGRECSHALGRAAELAEIRTSRPRALRVVRSLWTRPELVSLGVETRDALPREHARALASTFSSLGRRVR